MANSADVIIRTLKEGKEPVSFSFLPKKVEADLRKGGSVTFSLTRDQAGKIIEDNAILLFLLFDRKEMDAFSDQIDSEAENSEQ